MSRERKKKLTAAELKAAGVSREVVVRKMRRLSDKNAANECNRGSDWKRACSRRLGNQGWVC